MNIKVLAIFLLIALAFSTPSYADPKEEKIEWSEVPPKVQKTITEHILSGEILKTKKEKIILLNKKGEQKKTNVYLARVKKPDGKKIWIIVDKSGELIDVEDEETEAILEDEEERKNKKNN